MLSHFTKQQLYKVTKLVKMIISISLVKFNCFIFYLEVMCGPVSCVAERLSRIVGGAFQTVGDRELHARLVHVVIAN